MSSPPVVALPVRPVSELDPRPVEWLWPGHLALGRLALLDGDPGLGKSLIALDLCARLSRGAAWPDGTPAPGAWPSLVLQAEDSPHDTLRPRLQSLGADLACVFSLDSTVAAVGRPLRLPSDLAALEGAVARCAARLVVLDPLTAFLDPGLCTSYEPNIRAALESLGRFAEAHRCSFLLIRHLNKYGGGRALYRGSGHMALAAACRSVWLVAEAPGAADGAARPLRRMLAQVKNNLGPRQPSLALEVRPVANAPPVLTWLGPSSLTADELLARRPPGPPPSALDDAREVLLAALAEGPLNSDQLWARARAAGLSERTVYRARESLKIRIIKRFRDRQPMNYWLLAGQELPAEAPQDPEADAVDESLHQLNARWPAPNPLDGP